MHTTVVPRSVRRLARIVTMFTLVTAVLFGIKPESASAQASSWNPTLLVNTESFQTIDVGDGTTDVELRFGSSANALKFLTNGRFQFTKGIIVQGSISGSTLTISAGANISGSLMVRNNVTARGILSGTTLNVSGNADVQGSTLAINADASPGNAILTFGNTSGNQALTFLSTSQQFQFSRGLSVLGTISGSRLAIDGNATISGSLLVKNNIAAKGTVSGSTITGFGLGSCNGVNQKVVYNNATGKFECASDQTGSAGTNTGSLQAAFDNRYVNQSGDTMTGALTVQSGNSPATTNAVLLNTKGTISGAYLTVSGVSAFSGAAVFRTNATVKGILSGASLNVSGNADVQGSTLAINADASPGNAILTFGNSSGNQAITFLSTAQKFQFSRGINVLGTISGSALRVDGNGTFGGTLTATGSIRTKGNLSGSTLTVDGALNLRGVSYNAPTAQGAANTFLRNDGAGNLTWQTTSTPNGSGGIISIHPEFPNAIYFSSGSSFVGQMTMSGGTSALDNSYIWTSSRSGLQNYWVSVRLRLPDNFSSWDPIKPIELRYKTGVSGTTNNAVKVLIRDTAGAYVPLTNAEALSSTSFATQNITGPNTTGTWTPKGYFTVYVKLSANSTAGAYAAASYMNFNFETTTP